MRCENCPRKGEPEGPIRDNPSGKWCGSRGAPNAKLLVVGMSPGKDELQRGIPFVGASGKILAVAATSLEFQKAHMLNTVNCFPIGRGETLTKEQVVSCRPRLLADLQRATPKVALLLGGEALWATTGLRTITDWRGYVLEPQDAPRWVLPCKLAIAAFHPAFVQRTGMLTFRWLKRDVRRAIRILNGGLQLWESPNGSAAIPYQPPTRISVDIETDMATDEITQLGLAWD